MEATKKLGHARIEMPGRYAITIEFADDELMIMEAWFEAEVFQQMKHDRGYTDEEALA